MFGDEWSESKREQLEFANRVLPADEVRTDNLALLDFEAVVCTPTPRCSECFANEFCEYYERQQIGTEK